MRSFSALTSSLVLSSLPCIFAFHLYLPTTDKQAVIAAYGVREACFNALNSTLNCHGYHLVNTLDVDDWTWSAQNLTELCTTQCANDLQSWLKKVETNCGQQTIPMARMETYPTVFPHRYIDGYNTACLKSSGGSWCLPESYDWEGKEVAQYPDDYCATGDAAYDPPECHQFGFDINAYTAEDSRLVKLYPKSMLCSDCFIKIWQRRIQSPTLFSPALKEYYLSNYKDLQSLCSINVQATTFSGTLTKGPLLATPTQNVPAETTCAGAMLPKQTGQSSCKKLAEEYSVPSGTIRQLSGSYECLTETPLCLPPKCELYLVNGGQTCKSMVEKLSTAEKPITMVQFLSWNPYMLGPCDNLHDVQHVCRGPPGGTYVLPEPVTAPVQGTYTTTAKPALPTQSGSIKDCGLYYEVKSGDICQTVAIRHGITVDQLFEYNTYLTKDCLNLWAGTSVCVAKVTAASKASIASVGEPGSSNVTPDGTCGPEFHDWICGDSSFGKCCSIYGFCGSSSDFCGTGTCYSGDCALDIGGPSSDGSCGPNFAGDKVCAGTQFGKCCSKSGYCGDTADFCGKTNCHSGACET